ncbi:sulfite exporter TauE/SafE family protein [Tessaracoccus sp. MC1679]|uniref:sulfite exporter TauE/SafE family protein n=1 Tax=Tessaracoccus sp. MC1679 TaxID=2760313 RepID=UPI001603A748|nr:sulfite exporter TauE/SafE family protein [Tessaracoccus sp. MC1679]MBB1514580.1 sulfite exporter TauE/SafE family protein [Tessaracoccus sp. MC1679]
MTWWIAPLAIAVGLIMGALGGGGAIITVPVLVYLAGQPPAAAMAGSLIVVSVTASAGMIGHWRAGLVRPSEGVAFAALGSAGAIGGSLMSMQMPGNVLMALFAVLLLVVAAVMAKKFLRPSSASPRHVPPMIEREPLRVNWRQVGLAALTATGVGLLTGFFGVGGGFAIVPALVLALGFTMQQAVATSLLVIVLNSLVALATRLTVATDIDWAMIGWFSALAAVGAILGGRVGRRLPARTLGLGFAALLGVTSLAILAQTLTGLITQ